MLTAIWSWDTFSATLLLVEPLTTLRTVLPVGEALLMHFVFFSWFIELLCVGIIVVWHNLQYASTEPSLAFFNQRNVFSQLLLHFRTLSKLLFRFVNSIHMNWVSLLYTRARQCVWTRPIMTTTALNDSCVRFWRYGLGLPDNVWKNTPRTV